MKPTTPTPEEEKFVPVINFVAKRLKNNCAHTGSVVVDEEKRAVECSKCSAIVDPFDFLLKMCFKEDSAFDRFFILEVEVDKKQKKLHNLEKEIERLNRVKNALKNQP